MSRQVIKAGDDGQVFSTVIKVNGSPISLSSCSVKFVMRKVGDQSPLVRDAIIVNENAGLVEYEPTKDEVADPGDYDIEWRIVLPGDKQLTSPSDSFDRLTILPNLGEEEA